MKWGLLLIFLLSIASVMALQGPIKHNGINYYVVNSEIPSEDTGEEVCAKLGKTCVGYTEKSDAVCKKYHPGASSTTSTSGDVTGVYCNGPPQTNICSGKMNTCHTCPACSNGVDCGTTIGGLYREMYVECQGAPNCDVPLSARSTQELLDELPVSFSGCPIAIPKGATTLIGKGNVKINIKRPATETITAVIQNKQLTGLQKGSNACGSMVTIDEKSLNTMLQNPTAGTFFTLYKSKKIQVQGCNFWSRLKLFFVKPVAGLIAGRSQTPIPTSTQIGPYPGMFACEFYQIPAPGVNKKMVSCPYETPGAAINVADDAFCQTAMGSMGASAAICNANGLIVCVHPCPKNQFEHIPQRCAFDLNRKRGNQAPPFTWCEALPKPSVPTGAGRPSNCDDTYMQGHRGYGANKALWDSYSANTDAVCQTRERTGVPKGGHCAHTVQLSTGGIPYYLCWYNN